MAIVLGANQYGKAEVRYGLIGGTITRDDAPPPGKAW
jgi:hypothetical protein